MKYHSFHELVQRISNLSTRDKKKISITFGGSEAYTDGKRINLPALESGTILNNSQFSIWLGYALHEGPGHLAHSDMEEYISTVKQKSDPVFSQILNILEDVRIENKDISLYPGDRKYLNSTHQFCDDQIPPDKCQNPGLMGLIYKEAFVKYRNFDTGKLQGELKSSYPQISRVMSQLPRCQSTGDVIRLADELVNLIPKEQQQEQQKQSQQQTQSPTPPQAGGETQDEDGENDNDSDSGNNPGNNLDNEQLDNQPASKENRANGKGSPGNEQSSNQSDLPTQAQEWNELTEIGNILKTIIEETKNENNNNYQTRDSFHDGKMVLPPNNLSNDQIFVPGNENLNQYISTRNALSPQITALKKMFRIHLQAKSKKSFLRGLDEGQLDRERLHVVPTGSSSVFKIKHERQLINTAVELMLDLSASMNDPLVRSAAIVLAEALSSIPQIKLDICGFTTNNKNRTTDHRSYPLRIPNIGRLNGMDILVFKDFAEPYIKARARLGGIKKSNYTPLGDAYGKALERILPRSEPRKIIFLVTDGQPEFSKGDERHSEYLLMSHVHKKCQRYHVETLGLGIGDEQTVGFLKPYVDKCDLISSIETLPQTLMSILKGIVR